VCVCVQIICISSTHLKIILQQAHSTSAAMDATFTDTDSASASEGFTSAMPRLVIFGARGFVGSHIAQECLNSGLAVTGVSRSGRCVCERVCECECVCVCVCGCVSVVVCGMNVCVCRMHNMVNVGNGSS